MDNRVHVVGVQLAKQLDSREDIARVITIEVVESAFGFLPSYIGLARESEQTNGFLGLLII